MQRRGRAARKSLKWLALPHQPGNVVEGDDYHEEDHRGEAGAPPTASSFLAEFLFYPACISRGLAGSGLYYEGRRYSYH